MRHISRHLSMIAIGALACALACAPATTPRFPLREPLAIDTDLNPVSVPCSPDPDDDDPHRVRCAPEDYFSPFKWDRVDSTAFGPLSRILSVDVPGEAANANSLDEVADSAWFQARIAKGPIDPAELAAGACKTDDALPTDVPDGAWLIDHGKDNGATLGFRVDVPGKGKYLLKADEPDRPERASAAAVIGAALYHAAGFNTSCEQVVYIRRAQLKLKPGLVRRDSNGTTSPFDQAALDHVLASSTHRGDRIRMQASKWLPGLPIGPFRYQGTRDDDPNDIIDHEDRRELRGSRIMGAWLNHWDAREENSMDLWLSVDAKNKRSSPGIVRHYILDTSDCFGSGIAPANLEARLGFSYAVDFADILIDFVTLGAIERPWDRAHTTPGRAKFGMFNADDFDAEAWKVLIPNPAFSRMRERDGAWMARIIARFSADDIRAIVGAGQFSDPGDAEFLTKVLIERQHRVLTRYLTRLSPLADVHAEGDKLCARDLAAWRQVLPAPRFHYTATERSNGRATSLTVTTTLDGTVCVAPAPVAVGAVPDDDPARLVVIEIDNGTGAGPIEIHAYDLGTRGLRVVGLVRPPP